MISKEALECFGRGRICFQGSKFKEAVGHFSDAIALSPTQYIVYDCRSAAYEKLGQLKDALADAKRVIDVAPERWHGYARSARLFLKARKYDSSLAMVDLALERLKEGDFKRRIEFERLKAQTLRERRLIAEQQRQMASRTAYHFGKLPVELIAEIFQDVISRDWALAIWISHVSRQWRAIALSTPALWRTLVLSSAKNATRKVKEWVERSRECIRTFDIRCRVEDKILEACKALTPKAFQGLRILVLEGCGAFYDRYGSQFTNLEELQVADAWSTSVECSLWQLKNVPLRTLKLDRVNSSWSAIAETFTTLVHLELQECHMSGSTNLLPVLEANPLLQRVVVGPLFTTANPEPASSNPSFALEHLSYLAIDLRWVSLNIFGKIAMPSLQSLSLYRSTTPLDPIFHDLIHQGVNLVEFRVHKCVLSAAALVHYLHAIPTLHTFEVTYIDGVANTVIEALASPILSPNDMFSGRDRSSTPFLCPSLTHLDFSHCPDVKTGALLRLVKSRLADGSGDTKSSLAAITSLGVNGCPLIEADVLPWLRGMVPSFSCLYMSKQDLKFEVSGRKHYVHM